MRELIEETKEAVGEHCAVAVRFAADEEIGEDGIPIHGEHRDMIGLANWISGYQHRQLQRRNGRLTLTKEAVEPNGFCERRTSNPL